MQCLSLYCFRLAVLIISTICTLFSLFLVDFIQNVTVYSINNFMRNSFKVFVLNTKKLIKHHSMYCSYS